MVRIRHGEDVRICTSTPYSILRQSHENEMPSRTSTSNCPCGITVGHDAGVSGCHAIYLPVAVNRGWASATVTNGHQWTWPGSAPHFSATHTA